MKTSTKFGLVLALLPSTVLSYNTEQTKKAAREVIEDCVARIPANKGQTRKSLVEYCNKSYTGTVRDLLLSIQPLSKAETTSIPFCKDAAGLAWFAVRKANEFVTTRGGRGAGEELQRSVRELAFYRCRGGDLEDLAGLPRKSRRYATFLVSFSEKCIEYTCLERTGPNGFWVDGLPNPDDVPRETIDPIYCGVLKKVAADQLVLKFEKDLDPGE